MPISAGLLALSLSSALAAPVYSTSVGFDTNGATELITISPTGAASVSTISGQGPYDGSDDTYIGVLNNYSMTVSSLGLSCTDGCFGFDGDGIDTYANGGSNGTDTTGYGGSNAYFSNPLSNDFTTSNTVNFITAIAANGGTGYFSLEDNLSAASVSVTSVNSTPLPATWTMLLIGLVGVGFAASRTTTKQNTVAIA